MELPKECGFYTLDTVAECFDVSPELYTKLWELTSDAAQAGTAQPLGGDGGNGTTEIPIVGGSYSNVLENAWDKFSEDEQREILQVWRFR